MPRTGGPTFRSEVVKARKPSESLTAAAKRYQNGPGAQSINKTGRRTRSIEYQNDLWDFYDTVPEFRFACAWVGSLMSRVKLTVTFQGKPTTNQVALDALASLFGGPEGQAEMMRLLGINFTCVGEGYVVGQPDPKTGLDDWSVIASVEITKNGETILVEQEPLDDQGLAIRMWRAHPRKSSEADSPSRALMPVLAELVMLTQVVNAQGSSRLTSSGILWIPQEIEMPALPVGEMDENGDEPVESVQLNAADGVTQRLVKIASIAIGDRSSAAANVPFVIAAPGEHLEKIQKTEFWSGFDEHAMKLREEAIRRVGIGMDMPPEVLTGTGEINHWGAWSVEEAAIKSHTEPLAQIIVDSLTTGYLKPWMEENGVEGWDDYAFEGDTSELRLRPNRSKEALELWDRGAISIETLLKENGFDPETDRPEEAERIMFFLMKVAEKTSATPAQLAEALQQLGVKGMPTGEDEQAGALSGPRSLEQHPTQDIPDEEQSEAGVPRGLNASAQPVIIDPLVLAAEAHVHRALERAGNRLKNKVGGRSFGGSAADLYLSVPEIGFGEAETLLEDAWGVLDRFEYPGVRIEPFRAALHQYALFLLCSQKPMTRASLARHLMLELGDQAA